MLSSEQMKSINKNTQIKRKILTKKTNKQILNEREEKDQCVE